MWEFTNVTDFLLAPVILMVILFMARIYTAKKSIRNPEYKYFYYGLVVKLFGALGLWFIYTFYYPGGDTFEYYASAVSTNNLFYHDPIGFFSIWLGEHDMRKLSFFEDYTALPRYYRDPNTFFVVRMIIPLVFISFRSYIVCSLLLSTLSFLGIWQLYKVFINEYPALTDKLAIAIFFIPSVFFWGSGILKDTITLSMVGLFVSSFYKVYIRRNKMVKNGIWLLIASYVILSIKPYILIGLIPGCVFWIINRILSGIRGSILRFASAPLLIIIIGTFGYFLLNILEGSLGTYSMSNVLSRATQVNHDLKQDYYKGNSFDIGDYDATISSMLTKAPLAINATLFRPYFWEANNIVMFLSSIENLVILIFTLRVFMKTRLILWMKFLAVNHLLTFSIVFSLFFCFSVGVSTANFGSMVRYKIPAIPFYISSLYIIQYLWQKEKDEYEGVNIKTAESNINVLAQPATI